MEQRSKPDPARASDPELAAMVAAGDVAAFEVLMRRYNQVLYRLARSIVKDDTEAEDIVQEAYLLAWRNAGGFRGEASLATWLTRIVVNEAAGRLRKTRRRADIIELVPGAAGFDDLAEDAMSELEHRAAPDAPESAALARDFDIGVASAFSFDGERCDRIVAKVLARL